MNIGTTIITAITTFFFGIHCWTGKNRCRLVRKKLCKKLEFVNEKFDQCIAPEGFGRNSIGIFGEIGCVFRVKVLMYNVLI